MTHPERTILDYVGAIAYRKFDVDALNIPAFRGAPPTPASRLGAGQHWYMLSDLSPLDRKARELRPRVLVEGTGAALPTDLPTRMGSLNALLEGQGASPNLDFVQRLAIVLGQCASAMRWEPYNTYQVHRGIASARCLFTCDVRVAIRRADGQGHDLYRYVGDDHLLLRLNAAPIQSTLLADVPLAFALSGDLARCIDPYGDFAPNLVAPEAGLLLGQIEYLCAAVDWRTRARAVPDMLHAREVFGLLHESEMLVAVLAVEAEVDSSGLVEAPLRVSEPEWPREELAKHPVLGPLLAAMQDPGSADRARTALDARLAEVAPLADRTSSAAPPDCDVLELVKRRNSGNYLIGFVPRAEGFGEPQRDLLLEDWMRLVRLQGGNDLLGVDVRTYLTVLRVAGARAARYLINFRTGTAEPIETHGQDLVEAVSTASTMPMANFRELNMLVTLTCDFAGEVRALGPRGYLLAHQTTGWIAHAFGLAAARQNMFSRPVRMYDDGMLDTLLQLEGQPTLQLLSGHNRNGKLAFEIG